MIENSLQEADYQITTKILSSFPTTTTAENFTKILSHFLE